MLSPHSFTLAQLLFIITHTFLCECSFHHMPIHLAIYVLLLLNPSSFSSFDYIIIISSYANALGHLVCFTLLLNLSRVSLFHCSFHHFFVHFIISLFDSSYANALRDLVYLTLVLNPSRVSSFNYIIFIS